MTRRDFINGMAVAVVAGMTPLEILAKSSSSSYPPLWQNLVGSDDDSYFFAHALRDGEQYDFAKIPIQEHYDVVIIGAGISGLSAACLFHDKHKGTKSLILDNHKDFGGHARRNEFDTPYGKILTYGGSESLQSPKTLYSKQVVRFLHSLNIDIDTLAKCFDQDFYPDLGLSKGVFFNKKNFGVSKLVSGDPRVIIDDSIRQERNNARSFAEFIGDFPMPKADREALLELFTKPKDYLQGLSKKQKRDYLAHTSYKQFLQDKVKLSPLALSFFEGVSDDFMALGIDMISCELAQECALPGFEAIVPTNDAFEEPYIHHFPDGNASIARLMVKRLIPHIATCGNTPEEVLLARFDYSKLDLPKNMSRIRLQSTALDVRNVAGGVEIVYGCKRTNKLYKVFAKKAIMANYNAMIPYIVKELQEEQKSALSQCVKTSLIYTKVLLSNWECFTRLGIHDIYAPKSFYVNTKLDCPVDMGAYKHPRDPKKPICLHLIGSPLWLNPKEIDTAQLTARDLSRLTRHALLETPFSTLEQMTLSHLQEIFGQAGFSKRDVLGITLNRWGHCYAYNYNSLFDTPKQSQRTIKTARKVCGNIAIANSDANWDAFLHTAIEQAMRALSDLKLS
ncbi:NAD(P)-binding protein [Helicobacter canis]|uniref:Amine oxidase domain-containing protein n=1 Tax=Helicobacter canis NCTC 12740 TaxID=1357399 RepID=V8CI16_9HELI|nr:FAD/NAD(P)-binding protein [Helicobacter canis]ETD26670.1 hypothetical protein HMPREF2087_01055 [Helicobacter canis NCTC 12740]